MTEWPVVSCQSFHSVCVVESQVCSFVLLCRHVTSSIPRSHPSLTPSLSPIISLLLSTSTFCPLHHHNHPVSDCHSIIGISCSISLSLSAYLSPSLSVWPSRSASACAHLSDCFSLDLNLPLCCLVCLLFPAYVQLLSVCIYTYACVYVFMYVFQCLLEQKFIVRVSKTSGHLSSHRTQKHIRHHKLRLEKIEGDLHLA